VKKVIVLFLILLGINQILYFTKVQFVCDEKINSGQELNTYETFSALEGHCALWMFGWVVEPSTATICFCKQFNIHNPIIGIRIPNTNDPKLIQAKNILSSNKAKKVTLTWNKYTNRNSILLNGSTIQKFWDDGTWYYMYEIPSDYKPGMISIYGLSISETVFDYLENKGYLSSPCFYEYELIK